MAVSDNDKLKKIDEKMSQLKAKRQAILNREKEKERKLRTRRLIQNGALAEQYLQCNDLDTADFEAFLSLLANMPSMPDYIIRCKVGIQEERQRLERLKNVRENIKSSQEITSSILTSYTDYSDNSN